MATTKIGDHTVDFSIVSKGEFVDVDAYIGLPDGSEWLMTASRELSTSEESYGPLRFSVSHEADFDDGARACPADVARAFEDAKPAIRHLITSSLQLDGAVAHLSSLVTTPSNGVAICAASPCLSSTLTFRLGNTDKVIEITETELRYRGQVITDSAEQIAAFKTFISGLSSRRPPVMAVTMYAGLQPISKFDAVEVEPMIEDEHDPAELVPSSDDPIMTVCAHSVRLHYRSGGVETVADFRFDPSEPGANAVALSQADIMAASLGTMIMADDPTLPRRYVLRDAQLKLIEEALKNG